VKKFGRSAATRRRSLTTGSLLVAAAATLVAAAAGALQLEREHHSYPVSELVLEYALDHPEHLPLDQLLELEIGLRATEHGFVAPRPVDRTYRMKLSSLPEKARLFPSAIQHINWFIVLTLSRRGVDGVFVTVPEIEPGTGRDLRPEGQTRLRLRIWTGRIAGVTTLADGERFGDLAADERTNHPSHEWIRKLSPLRPGGPKGLLRIEKLNDYAFALSRHPGRRVDAELSPGGQPGTTEITYRVAENRPWLAYAQYSNTGTDSTTTSRERLGFVHNQLMGRDDMLRLDYVTGNFDSVHGAAGAYEAPFRQSAPRLRWRVSGGWSRFDAREVGFSLPGFEGEQWEAGAELVYNVWQHHQLFVDLEAGVRWQHVEVENRLLPDVQGNDDFFLPRLGAVARRNTLSSSLLASLDLEGNVAAVAGTSGSARLAELGRQSPDPDFVVLHWDGSYSFYLEPLLNRSSWRDTSTPESSTLAHEVALAFKGQWAFDRRLVPQFEQVAGGLYTVRGYPQSVAAGDTAVIGSAEYRFHLSRIFLPDPQPPELPLMGEFRARPLHLYGQPDWDLIFRVFVDAAHVMPSSGMDFERDETLAGAGGGIELQLLRHLSLRLDAGVALSEADDGATSVGDTRLHLVGTLLY
jgi:hemolysin activation/secretion protein